MNGLAASRNQLKVRAGREYIFGHHGATGVTTVATVLRGQMKLRGCGLLGLVQSRYNDEYLSARRLAAHIRIKPSAEVRDENRFTESKSGYFACKPILFDVTARR